MIEKKGKGGISGINDRKERIGTNTGNRFDIEERTMTDTGNG